nr:transposase [Actinokineospora cianjurensis]
MTGGNVNDRTRFAAVMAGIEFRRPGPGRPATRPSRVIADKGYSTKAIRAHLRGRGSRATIPERRDQQANRRREGRAGGRPPAFDRTAYKRRDVVERCFNRLKQFRAIAARSTGPPPPTEACSTWPLCSSGFEDRPSADQPRSRQGGGAADQPAFGRRDAVTRWRCPPPPGSPREPAVSRR